MINNVSFTGMREKLARKAMEELKEVKVVRASSNLTGTLNEATAKQSLDVAQKRLAYVQANPQVVQYTSPFAPINIGTKLNQVI